MRAIRFQRMAMSTAALVLAALAASAATAAGKRCDDDGGIALYLIRPVDGMSPPAIADEFIDTVALEGADAHVRRFWAERGTREGTIEGLLEDWKGSSVAKNTVRDRKAFIEMVRQLRKVVIAFEQMRVTAPFAAELLPGEWKDWRAKHLNREEFVAGFISDATSRRERQGKTDYEAVLHAAQFMRNRLDDLHGAAGRRDPPDDQSQMWSWDLYIRGQAAKAEISILVKFRDGQAYWNEFLIGRKAVLRCVAARRPQETVEKVEPKQERQAAIANPPPPATAPAGAGADVIGRILAAMKENRFTERPQAGVEGISLSVGKNGYAFFNVSNNEQCNFMISKPDRQVVMVFADTGCDGVAEGKKDGDKFVRLSEDEAKSYKSLLNEFLPFVQAMQKYGKDNPHGTLNFLRMMPIQMDNIKRMKRVLNLLEQTAATDFDQQKKVNTVIFRGSNDLAVVLAAEHDGQYYTNCSFAEISKGNPSLQLIDEDCNGSMEWAGKSGEKVKHVNPVLNAEVYKSVLVEMERFLEHAAVVFPR